MINIRITHREASSIPNCLVDYCRGYASPSWQDLFKEAESDITHIETMIKSLGNYYPLIQDVFRAYDLTPLGSVRVVIIGQDPYHNEIDGQPQACGLAFSTRRNCPLQPSIRNIYKEIQRSHPNFVMPTHGDLTSWTEQGVMLLNICLTVCPHMAGSHKKIWMGFITRTIQHILKANPECIFLLWGNNAQALKADLGEKTVKLYATHPSGYSFDKASKTSEAFYGCDHFVKVNKILIERGETPINWQIPE